MKENKKELSQKSKKVVIVVIVLLIILLAIFLMVKFLEFPKTSNDEMNMNSGEAGVSGEMDEEKYWEDTINDESLWEDYVPEDEEIDEEIIPYSGEKIEEAEFEMKGIKVSNFKVESLNNSTNIAGEIENQLNKKINSVTLKMNLYNGNEEIIYDYSMVVSNIEAKEKRNVETNIGTIFTELDSIYVEAIEIDVEK